LKLTSKGQLVYKIYKKGEQMKRKVLSLFLALVLVLSFSLATALPASADPGQEATITAPTRTMDEDATFNVPIAIDDTGDPAMSCAGFQFDITTTEATLTLNSVSAGALLPGGWSVYMSGKTTAGSYDTWTVFGDMGGGGTPVTGDGELIVLNYTGASDFDDAESTSLDLSNAIFSIDGEAEVTMTLVDGSATVDLLEVTAATVVGDNTATSEGYVSASDEHTTFTLTPTVTGGDGGPYTYLWNFGADGTGTTTDQVPSDVEYSSAGAKSITLEATDGDSSTSTFTVGSIPATIYADLVADFTADTGTAGHAHEGIVKPDGGGYESTTNYPSTVTFTGSSTGGKAPLLYTDLAGWDPDNDATIEGHTDGFAYDYEANADSDITGTIGKVQYTAVLTIKDSLLPAYDIETKDDLVTIWRAGNVNMDDSLGAADLTKIRLILQGTDAATFTSDVNDDTSINIHDVVKLLGYLP
jgi:hypothetical protein